MTNPKCKTCNGKGVINVPYPAPLRGIKIEDCPDCTKPDVVTICANCDNQGWVCEDHAEVPWGDGDGCCGGAGEPCVCNPIHRNNRLYPAPHDEDGEYYDYNGKTGERK